jgi:hypothetical protein
VSPTDPAPRHIASLSRPTLAPRSSGTSEAQTRAHRPLDLTTLGPPPRRQFRASQTDPRLLLLQLSVLYAQTTVASRADPARGRRKAPEAPGHPRKAADKTPALAGNPRLRRLSGDGCGEFCKPEVTGSIPVRSIGFTKRNPSPRTGFRPYARSPRSTPEDARGRPKRAATCPQLARTRRRAMCQLTLSSLAPDARVVVVPMSHLCPLASRDRRPLHPLTVPGTP